MIGVDWGTSNFRAFLLDARGNIRDRRKASCGVPHVPRRPLRRYSACRDRRLPARPRRGSGAGMRRDRQPRRLAGDAVSALPHRCRRSGPRERCGAVSRCAGAAGARRRLRGCPRGPRHDAQRGDPDRRHPRPVRQPRSRLPAGNAQQVGAAGGWARRKLHLVYDRRGIWRAAAAHDFRMHDA